eukprot:TRINITY_DN4546_c0_g2_i1.p1 TRINITY_DN4546_c0_g2~~TRINITY_DN4546_c0_g2_i1.p1  ORF type:complete len:189 (+),score=10.35 TRINITY_DN4546_c0_g2_i1:66-632(+)
MKIVTTIVMLALVIGEGLKFAGVLSPCVAGWGIWFVEESLANAIVALFGVGLLLKGTEESYGSCVALLGLVFYAVVCSISGWVVWKPALCRPGLLPPLFALLTSAFSEMSFTCHSVPPLAVLLLVAMYNTPQLPTYAPAWLLGMAAPPPFGSFGGFVAGVLDPILAPVILHYVKHTGVVAGDESLPLL